MSTLVVVAVGDSFIRETEVAVRTFMQHNFGWHVERYYDQDLVDILPDKCKAWTPFNMCEIGRWCAIRKAIEHGAKHVLYCDGDMMWFGAHVSDSKAPLILTPHYILPESGWRDYKVRLYFGVVNLGLIEAFDDSADMLTAFIDGAIEHAGLYSRIGKIWLQPYADSWLGIGHKITLNKNPSTNVAKWNLRKERKLIGTPEQPRVLFQDWEWPLISLHLSGEGKSRGKFGPVMDAFIDRQAAWMR